MKHTGLRQCAINHRSLPANLRFMSTALELLDMPETERNWAELPLDVMALIFEKAGSIVVLLSAQAVCSSWRKLAHETRIWRVVNFMLPFDLYDEQYDLEKMAFHAIDRSQGQLVGFYMENFCSDVVIEHLAKRTSILRHLRLVSCYNIMDEAIIESFKKFPLLEELEVSFHSFSEGVLEAAGRLCPKLNRLKLNCNGFRIPRIECDEEALAIANSMPQLNYLQLFGNKLTNDGLLAILRGCPHIKSLDLRQCYNVKLEGSWLENCAERMEDLRLPEDPTDDFGYCANFGNEGHEYGISVIGDDTIDDLHGGSDIDDFMDDMFGALGYDDFTNPWQYGSDGEDSSDDSFSGH